MPYCSKQDLINKFNEDELISLTDRNDLNVIDDAVLNEAIESACAIIDGYIGGRYPLPLSSEPKVLKTFACDMTRYQLYDDEASDQVTKRNDAAINFFKGVARGEVTLGISVSGEAAQTNDFAQMESAGTVFSRKNSSSFI